MICLQHQTLCTWYGLIESSNTVCDVVCHSFVWFECFYFGWRWKSFEATNLRNHQSMWSWYCCVVSSISSNGSIHCHRLVLLLDLEINFHMSKWKNIIIFFLPIETWELFYPIISKIQIQIRLRCLMLTNLHLEKPPKIEIDNWEENHRGGKSFTDGWNVSVIYLLPDYWWEKSLMGVNIL